MFDYRRVDYSWNITPTTPSSTQLGSKRRLHVVLIHQILGVMHHDIVHALRLVGLPQGQGPGLHSK